MDVWSLTLYQKKEVNALFIANFFKSRFLKDLDTKKQVVFDTTWYEREDKS